MRWFRIRCPFCQKKIPLSSIRCPECRSQLPHECGDLERKRLFLWFLAGSGLLLVVITGGIGFVMYNLLFG